MVDEIKLGKAQHRGIRAEELLGEGSLFREIMDKLHSDYLAAWKATKVMQTAEREKLWQATQILEIINDHLKSYVINGRIAASDLQRFSNEAERKLKKAHNG